MNNLESGDFLDFNKQNRGSLLKRISLMLPKKKEVYFEKLNDIKDFYQEKIEAKTGIDLGDIRVKPYNELSTDHFYNLLISHAKKLDENNKLSHTSKNIGFNMAKFITSVYDPFMNTRVKIENNFKGQLASYEDNNIYFPTGLRTTFSEVDDTEIGQVMVHELSHALWEKISGKLLREDYVYAEDKESLNIWSEGFAEYARMNYFKEFYNPNSEVEGRNNLVYGGGYEKVKAVVEVLKEDFLEIPKIYKELDKKYDIKIIVEN